MKQVTITHRVVYHKIVELDINVPSQINENDLQNYLLENEQILFLESLQEKLRNATFDFGFGLEYHGMEDKEQPCETRYDVIENGKIIFGGHL
mgnify:CR=1 FL=1